MDGSSREFQDIYAAFQPKILRYLIHLVGEAEAEDLTQDVFIRVNRSLRDFKGKSKLSTWIYRIATNLAMDRWRSPAFRSEAPDCASECSLQSDELEIGARNIWTGERPPAVEQQIYRKEMNTCLLSFITKLPEDHRTVLLLSEYEGLKNGEIADILGVSLDTVKIRLHRARVVLKDELAKHCDPYWVEDNEFLPELRLI